MDCRGWPYRGGVAVSKGKDTKEGFLTARMEWPGKMTLWLVVNNTTPHLPAGVMMFFSASKASILNCFYFNKIKSDLSYNFTLNLHIYSITHSVAIQTYHASQSGADHVWLVYLCPLMTYPIIIYSYVYVIYMCLIFRTLCLKDINTVTKAFCSPYMKTTQCPSIADIWKGFDSCRDPMPQAIL